jgi:very-short-patch-repair endonuclease
MKKIKFTNEEFIRRAREVHGNKYDYSLVEYTGMNNKVIICLDGVQYEQSPNKHILAKRCPEKNTPKKTTEEFLKEAKAIWGDKYDYSLTEYTGSLNKVKIILDGIIYEQRASTHINPLKKCVEKEVTFEAFLKRAKIKYGDKYDYSEVQYVNVTTPVKIKLGDKEYYQTPFNHLSFQPENISKARRMTTKEFIEQSNLVHDNLYKYDKVEYKKSQIKVVITCPNHGDFEQIPMSHLAGHGCRNCNESKGEKAIAKFLTKNNIHFERQYKFKDCRNIYELPFDFYIPSMRTVIEYDGEQHFKPLPFFGGEEAFNTLKINDAIKTEYCEDNMINIVRISYEQYNDIAQILWKGLNYHMRRLKMIKSL